jgi:hypothetical protein
MTEEREKMAMDAQRRAGVQKLSLWGKLWRNYESYDFYKSRAKKYK